MPSPSALASRLPSGLNATPFIPPGSGPGLEDRTVLLAGSQVPQPVTPSLYALASSLPSGLNATPFTLGETASELPLLPCCGELAFWEANWSVRYARRISSNCRWPAVVGGAAGAVRRGSAMTGQTASVSGIITASPADVTIAMARTGRPMITARRPCSMLRRPMRRSRLSLVVSGR